MKTLAVAMQKASRESFLDSIRKIKQEILACYERLKVINQAMAVEAKMKKARRNALDDIDTRMNGARENIKKALEGSRKRTVSQFGESRQRHARLIAERDALLLRIQALKDEKDAKKSTINNSDVLKATSSALIGDLTKPIMVH